MATIVESDVIDGVYFIDPVVHADARGLFVETFRREWIPGAREMIQANRADRRAGSVVGLHFHRGQADYWYVPFGRARVVLHDLRANSDTDGQTIAFDLGAREDGSHDHRGVFIPPGVGHGFAALTDVTLTYLVDGYYDPTDELGIAWNDPELAADWGVTDPVVSERDRALPMRAALDPELRLLFVQNDNTNYWTGTKSTGRGGR